MKQLIIYSNSDIAENLCDALMEWGALSASVEDADVDTPREKPVFIEPDWVDTHLWPNCHVKALLDASVQKEAVEAFLEKIFSRKLLYTLGDLPEKDWIRESLQDFVPLKIGARLWIVPSWHTPPSPDAVNVIFDPGLAFGTGKHPTTRMCLAWLEKNLKEGNTVLDFGCGSGILGISALKLGAGYTAGTDIDPQALEASRQNAIKNGVSMDLYYPEKLPPRSFDVLVANILANPLIAFASSFSGYLRKGGAIVLSGLLEDQAEEVMKAYRPFFKMNRPKIEEGWACLSGRKK